MNFNVSKRNFLKQIYWAFVLLCLSWFLIKFLLSDHKFFQELARSFPLYLYEVRAIIVLIWAGVGVYYQPIKSLLIKQKMCRMPSWVAYWHLFQVTLLGIITGIAFSGRNHVAVIISPILIMIVYCVIYFFFLKKDFKPYDAFAEGATNKDELDFKDSSKNLGGSLLKLSQHVNVVVVDGGIGDGKSSYVRMMIEQIPPKEILYTYISLTETNEANDFGKLFANRWLETLNSRYPVMAWLRKIEGNLLQSIFQWKDERFWIRLFRLILAWNMPLFSTKATIWDKELVVTNDDKQKYSVVSKDVAKHFLCIPEIKEKAWILVIDELERSPLDEVFRLVEVIERFKLQGRSGLPVKLIFMLCVSMEDLRGHLEYPDPSCAEKARLIKEFLFEGRKNIDILRRIPTISRPKKEEWITTLIQGMGINDSLKNFED